ncbi:MAG: hypothetical protein ACYTGQ_08825 [Planctomycetota bacterium]|jgi:hypothetical protein
MKRHHDQHEAETKADRPWPVRVTIWCMVTQGCLCLYVASLGPVLAIAGHVWDRVWPDWFRNIVEIVYAPILWCEANIPAVHAMIDKYVNWWVNFLDL